MFAALSPVLLPDIDDAPAPNVSTEVFATLPTRPTVPVFTVNAVVRVALVTAPAVSDEAVPVSPAPLPANPVEVKIPVEGINESFDDVVFCGRLPVFAVTQVG